MNSDTPRTDAKSITWIAYAASLERKLTDRDATIARLREALDQAETVLMNQHPVFKPLSTEARVAIVVSGISAALNQE